MGNSSYFAGKRAGKREAQHAQEMATIEALSSFATQSIESATQVALAQTTVIQALVDKVDSSEDATACFEMALNFLLNSASNQSEAELKTAEMVLGTVERLADKAIPLLVAKEQSRQQRVDDLAKMAAKLEALEQAMPRRRRKSS